MRHEAERLRAEEARAAGKYADHHLPGISPVEDQRTTRVAAGSDAFIGQRIVTEQVEIENGRSRRATAGIVKIGPVKILAQTRWRTTEDRDIAHAERRERTQPVFGHAHHRHGAKQRDFCRFVVRKRHHPDPAKHRPQPCLLV